MRGDCFEKHHHMQRFMEVCLLTLLCEPQCEICHGYALAERLEQFGFRTGEINASTLYRTLRGMEEAGWVTSRWESGGPGPQRRAYGITQAGHGALTEWVEVLRIRRERIGLLLVEYEKLEQAPGKGHTNQ
jgi:PadR family transcriptional regulator, regulatory protein PadR